MVGQYTWKYFRHEVKKIKDKTLEYEKWGIVSGVWQKWTFPLVKYELEKILQNGKTFNTFVF